MAPGIIAGSTDSIKNSDIKKDPAEWLIVDIGFSMEDRSCCVWTGTEGAKVVTFGNLVQLLKLEFRKKDPLDLNLVIEAPLSIAFQKNGNPTLRACYRLPDKSSTGQSQSRPWYTNAGATTFIAAQTLFRELRLCQVRRTVGLFEGFLSFKRSGDESITKGEAGHIEDVLKLKNAIWTGRDREIFGPGKLRERPDHGMESAAFPFLDRDLIPPVIRIRPDA